MQSSCSAQAQSSIVSLAKRLNELCEINVKKASNGDEILRCYELLAPGNYRYCQRYVGSCR